MPEGTDAVSELVKQVVASRTDVGVVTGVIKRKSGEIYISYTNQLGLNLGFRQKPEENFVVKDLIEVRFGSGMKDSGRKKIGVLELAEL